MSMGKRTRNRQSELWVSAQELPKPPGHPFYQHLNRLLDKHGFDDFVEGECFRFYAPSRGRPGVAPGIYFRLLLVGYFEGLSSERGIAWRHCHVNRVGPQRPAWIPLSGGRTRTFP